MADSLRHLSDAELEQALVSLGADIAYPPTRDLVRRVRQQIETPSPRGLSQVQIGAVRLAIAVAAALLLVSGFLALFPTARTAIANRLGLPGVVIRYLPFVPSPTATPTPAPTPRPTKTPIPIGLRLHLGERMTLAAARARVAYRVLTPTLASLGPPDEVYLETPPAGGQVALVYHPRPELPEANTTGVGLLLTELRGTVNSGLLGKGIGPGTQLEQVSVSGHPGYWIEGNPHLFWYQDANGEIQEETVRLAANTLIWQDGDLVLRIESALDRGATLRDHQLAVAAICPLLLAYGDAAAVAADLDCPTRRVCLRAPPADLSPDAARELAVAEVARAAALAASADIGLALEPLDRQPLVPGPTEALAIIDQAGRDNVGLMLETFPADVMRPLIHAGGLWDEWLTLYGSAGRAELVFPPPLLVRQPARLALQTSAGGQRPALPDREAFTEEMLHAGQGADPEGISSRPSAPDTRTLGAEPSR